MYKHILLPTDGSALAQSAVQYGITLAKSVGAKVTGLSQDLQFFAFQSQGMSGGPWLGPTVESAMLGLKRQGHIAVVIAPIGFVCDHVEVLYDLDIEARKIAEALNVRFVRASCPNDHPAFVQMIAEVIEAKIRAKDR